MSDFWISFIPEEPSYILNNQTIDSIKKLSWYKDNVAIFVKDNIQFVDAGTNFKKVSCPFCNFDLINWWGNAMNEAYSDEDGFINLDIVTPCCHKNSSLHCLDYDFPQGFYTSIIEMRPFYYQGVLQIHQEIFKDTICQELFELTNETWRIVYTHI